MIAIYSNQLELTFVSDNKFVFCFQIDNIFDEIFQFLHF